MQDSIKRKLVEFGVPLLIILSLPIVWLFAPRHNYVRINCDIAEISPDIPPAAKEQCRQLRARKNLHEPK